ncbi:MAG: methyltransferase [Pseudomonadota bacterium]
MTFRSLILAASAITLAACSQAETETVEAAAEAEVATTETSADLAGAEVEVVSDAEALATILAAQDEATQARYDARNPAETLDFFGIKPGMAVGEALPGGGWYSKILLPYLGEEGHLVAVDYTIPMWGEFGGFATDEFLANKETWPTTWVEEAQGWTDSEADISAYTFGTLPQDESLDAFLFIRAMHNLSRFDETGGYMGEALTAVHGSLKPGGVVGVVQHASADDADAAWATGAAGYLRKPDVVAAFEAAGFELVGESDVNANPLDNPTTEDFVWRLPPSLGSTEEGTEERAAMEAIGESNRMTLLFRKAS